jgi:hypothetical protein
LSAGTALVTGREAEVRRGKWNDEEESEVEATLI